MKLQMSREIPKLIVVNFQKKLKFQFLNICKLIRISGPLCKIILILLKLLFIIICNYLYYWYIAFKFNRSNRRIFYYLLIIILVLYSKNLIKHLLFYLFDKK